jgi:23S rRNA (adenine2030-N6)-methyltransferase
MLSYQHRYHAGNFADVHKHLVLTLALQGLARKPAPFSVIDSHAGEGLYDLTSPEAVRNAEYRDGIETLLDAPDPPPLVRIYLECVRAENAEGPLRFYPGSPRIAERLSRPGDEIALAELHPQALAELHRTFRRASRVHIHKRDGFEAITALTPPATKRGLVVIDPAYEQKSDYDAVIRTIEQAYRRWSIGGYLLWYPLLPQGRHEALLQTLKDCGIKKILRSEWVHKPPTAERGLYGSGIAWINPVWSAEDELRVIGDWLVRIEFGTGPAILDWLAGE